MGVYGKKRLKKKIRPVLLDSLYVTYTMFLMHCFETSKFYNSFSFQKAHLFKTKNIKTAEKSLIDR